jgi:HEAT repeat protein
MRYLAAHGNPSSMLDILLQIKDPLLQRPLLNAARWLRDAPREAAWRGKIMAGLAHVLKSEDNPRSLRGQAMAAFALCGDPGAAAFFRQSLQSPSFELIPLAALGSGAIQDTKAVELLSSTMSAPTPATRRAACLALVAIGTPSALEAVARALLGGDEELRRAAAEALANDPKEGHAMLQDGATLTDILVRRAVVYGLGRVNEPWAVETLKRVQVDDDQWIVRNAATEVLDSRAHPANPRIPRPLSVPSETPWLIEFAGKQGVGISPGVPATDVLLNALKNGKEETR